MRCVLTRACAYCCGRRMHPPGFDSGGSSGKGRAAAAARQPPKGTRFGKGKGKAAKQREQSNLLRRTRTEPVRQSGGHISVSGSSRSIELGIPVGRRMWTDARAWGDHFGSDLPDWYGRAAVVHTRVFLRASIGWMVVGRCGVVALWRRVCVIGVGV